MDEQEVAYARGWRRACFDTAGVVRLAQRTIGFDVPEPLLAEARRRPAAVSVSASVYPLDRRRPGTRRGW